MKLAARISVASIALLAIQLALVSSVAAKYLYERKLCPKVWTRAIAVDPESLMRGRYLSLQLEVNGCQSTLPTARQAIFGRNIDGTVSPSPYGIASRLVSFEANLVVRSNKLLALRIPTDSDQSRGQMVTALPGSSCEAMRLADSVSFYLPDKVSVPGQTAESELWIEVTVPSQGPPRPLQLAWKDHGVWKPLNFQ
jgi:hypothetical protein